MASMVVLGERAAPYDRGTPVFAQVAARRSDRATPSGNPTEEARRHPSNSNRSLGSQERSMAAGNPKNKKKQRVAHSMV